MTHRTSGKTVACRLFDGTLQITMNAQSFTCSMCNVRCFARCTGVARFAMRKTQAKHATRGADVRTAKNLWKPAWMLDCNVQRECNVQRVAIPDKTCEMQHATWGVLWERTPMRVAYMSPFIFWTTTTCNDFPNSPCRCWITKGKRLVRDPVFVMYADFCNILIRQDATITGQTLGPWFARFFWRVLVAKSAKIVSREFVVFAFIRLAVFTPWGFEFFNAFALWVLALFSPTEQKGFGAIQSGVGFYPGELKNYAVNGYAFHDASFSKSTWQVY